MIIDLVLFATFIILLIFFAKLYSGFFTKVVTGEKNILTPVLSPLENLVYKFCNINGTEMSWKEYSFSLLIFNILGIVLIVIILLTQHILPLNQENFVALPFDLAFNTAVSFVTNTNWQNYSGETTMSYFSQMFALSVQNFLSASTGIAVAVALIRGITRKESEVIGNFWVDLTRVTLFILLPLSILFSIFLISQGVIQNILPYVQTISLEGINQTIPMGPVASQEAIKLLGTNGGGFFNANSSHPFENPTPLSNFIEAFSIFFLSTSLIFVFGNISKKYKDAYSILVAMLILFVLMLGANYLSEKFGNPQITSIIGDSVMEGKEMRFGIASTSLFSTVTTAASCGAVNAMHDSLTPIAGMITILQMMLGEIIIGGVGAGFYGMILYVILSVFIAGLMIGRTPKYMGKKIEAPEMSFAVIAILLPSICILAFSAITLMIPSALESLSNPNSHGITQILYAFTSASANNGSAFAGLSGNTSYFNYALAFCMFVGRFGIIVLVLAIAGNLASKKIVPQDKGTLKSSGFMFIVLLICTILLTGALTFFPSLVLGPIVDHFTMIQIEQN